METIVATATREHDLAPMVVVRRADGTLHSRRRMERDGMPEDSLGVGADERWRHVGSNGLYRRRATAYDLEEGVDHHLYTSEEDGVSWLRVVSEWEETVRGSPRFVRES